jgi:hypothetical protein
MGSMSALGHVLVASASGEVDAVWDLLDEMAVRHTGRESAGVVVHSLGPEQPRFCVHPTGEEEHEFRHDVLLEALLMGAVWLAGQLGDDLWRRD